MGRVKMNTGLRLGALLIFGSSLFGATIIGQDNFPNCYPFACFAMDGGTVYEQLYSKTAFSGPIDISSIDFYAEMDSAGQPMDSAIYTISFSTVSNGSFSTSSSPDLISQGANSQVFGTFNISGTMPATLTLTGTTPFEYNPSMGNLLMYVTVDSIESTCYYCSFFKSDISGKDMSRAWLAGAGSGSDTVGLVTGFDVVPEPASAFLWGAGAVALALMGRRRLKK